MTEAGIYSGDVFHGRFHPKSHFLKYKVFMIHADLDQLDELSNKCKLFSLNRFNIMSFYESDFGNPDRVGNRSLRTEMLDLLEQYGVNSAEVSRIEVLTFPRIMGYVFNPISVFMFYGENDEHIAIVYEVRNTFSERHNYVFPVAEGGRFEDIHETDKMFHVSPFFDRMGKYRFLLKAPSETASVLIDYRCEETMRMRAGFTGERKSLDDRAILKSFARIPFMTIKITAGILYEALRLKLKGLKIFSHPEKHIYQSSLASSVANKNANKNFVKVLRNKND